MQFVIKTWTWHHKIVEHTLHYLRYLRINNTSNFFIVQLKKNSYNGVVMMWHPFVLIVKRVENHTLQVASTFTSTLSTTTSIDITSTMVSLISCVSFDKPMLSTTSSKKSWDRECHLPLWSQALPTSHKLEEPLKLHKSNGVVHMRLCNTCSFMQIHNFENMKKC